MPAEVVAAIIAAVATLAAAIVGAVVTFKRHDKGRKKDVEVTVYESIGDYISAFESRIRKAKRVDDVSWEQNLDEQWAGQDWTALRHLYETIAEVIKKPNVIWRDVVAFSSRGKFEQYRQAILEPDTPGHSLAYYEAFPSTSPPLIGLSVVDSGEKNAEVFLVVRKMRLRIKHPDIVDYFSRYFELIWKDGTKLKRGTRIEHTILQALEAQVMAQGEQQEESETQGDGAA